MSERCPHGEQKVACSTCTIAALEAEVARLTSELERVRNAEALATARHLTELKRPVEEKLPHATHWNCGDLFLGGAERKEEKP